MKKFIHKIIIFSLPFWCLLLLYFMLDPFKVLYQYESYFDDRVNGTVFLNTDYVATTNFDDKYNRYHYTSFIFGNSRAWFYRIADWQEYIGNEPAYHFDAAGETLYAMHKKIMYLDDKGVNIKNALLVLDPGIISETKPKTGHLGTISPQLVDYDNWMDFHVASFSGFLNIQFLFAYLDFIISQKVKPYMVRNHLIENRPFSYNPVYNELSFYYYDAMIQYKRYYTEELIKNFYRRSPVEDYAEPCIKSAQEKLFREIAYVFKKHRTRVKIIISPLYDQIHLSEEDLNQLVSIFGRSCVYDFSGKNSITEDYTNYYETSHYRPVVAERLLSRVYRIEQQAGRGNYSRTASPGL